MNLEDFKSFCRVLIPSEVGSIPTHSRHCRAGLLLASAVLLLGGGPARAQTEEGPAGPSPFNRALRSAVFPGWGQLSNGRTFKTVGIFGVETYLLTRILMQTRRGAANNRQSELLRSMGDEAGADQQRSLAEHHYETRRDLIFWGILAAFYGAMDAYIDAHLGNFDEDIEEGKGLFTRIDPLAGSFELGMRY